MPRHPLLNQAIALSNAGRNAEAVQLLRQVASTGDPDALGALAEATWRGGLVEQDPVGARTLYEQAAAAGHAKAAMIVTNLLASGVAGKQDWGEAMSRLGAEARAYPARRRALELLEAMVLDAEGNPVAVPDGKQLSDDPDVAHFTRLFTDAECNYLMQASGNAFEPSMVYDSSRRLVRDQIRTSDGATIHWLIEDPAIVALNRRIAAVSHSAYENGEALALLRYSPGQEYRPHFDFVSGAGNRRLQTALVYLNADYEGGETRFVRTGLTVKGGAGDVVLFRNEGADGGPNPLSEHAGLPVTRGTKYLATRWIRESRWIP
ncbi:MAG: 2OG-Fe(II) oxygenase [Pseudomonadota bacterium]|nr:2OG-Fe(II) oxygenase [Pseudomonadota bacterium]